jgi:hypothetical protein
MKHLIIILPLLLLAGCAGKTRLVPQAYMPEPPEILMKEPRELNTIKVTKNVTDDKEKDEKK